MGIKLLFLIISAIEVAESAILSDGRPCRTESCIRRSYLKKHPDQYINPIRHGDFPDPGAIYVMGSFYIATTGLGFPISTSRDMAHWEPAGHVFNRVQRRSFFRRSHTSSHPWATHDFWAPELHRLPNGSFALHYTARAKMKPGQELGQLSVGLAISPDVLGPYTDVGYPLAQDDDSKYMYLDSNYFYDDETKQAYLLWKRGTITPPEETDTVIYIQNMDSTATKLLGEKSIILKNDLQSWEEGVVEAPWLMRPPNQDYYYLFYSGAHCCDGSGSYAVGVARAKNITGPYEKYEHNPILHKNEHFSAPGHCSVLPSPGNPKEFVMWYHAAVSDNNGHLTTERMLLMDFLKFDAESGWPQLLTKTQSPSMGFNKVPSKL